MKERVDIERTTNSIIRAEEFAYVNTALLNDGTASPTGQCVPGYQYLLPPLGNVFPARKLRVIVSSELSAVPGTVLAIAEEFDLVGFFITLRAPDGTYIVHDFPLLRFAQLTAKDVGLFFDADALIDPRQSYVWATTTGAVVVAFMISFA